MTKKITQYINKSYTPERAAKMHHAMKEICKSGKVVCNFEKGSNKISANLITVCGKKFYIQSESYQCHLLFEHYILRNPCHTKIVKKIELDCIEGFAKRPKVLKLKHERKKELRERKRSVRCTFRKFWNNITNQYGEKK